MRTCFGKARVANDRVDLGGQLLAADGDPKHLRRPTRTEQRGGDGANGSTGRRRIHDHPDRGDGHERATEHANKAPKRRVIHTVSSRELRT